MQRVFPKARVSATQTPLFALGLLTLAMTMILVVPQARAQVISVTPTTIDFGTMNQMESRDTSVRVTNEGAGLLIIREVEADCGCTVPVLAKKQLAPGESTVIEINFNSKKFHGKIMKMVHIYSNDPDYPVTDITLLADVFAPLLVDPPTQRVGFPRSMAGQTFSKQVTFTSSKDAPLEITATRSRSGHFEVKTTNNYEGDPHKAMLEVILPRDMAPGRLRDNVRVHTNIEEMPTVDIEVASWVVQQLLVSQEQINFRYRQAFESKVRVSPFDPDLEWKVTGAEIDLPEITVTVNNTIPNREALVMLSGAPISKDDPRAIKNNGRIKGTLKIFTDVKDLPPLEVPVTYMIRM